MGKPSTAEWCNEGGISHAKVDLFSIKACPGVLIPLLFIHLQLHRILCNALKNKSALEPAETIQPSAQSESRSQQ